ncbi:NADPH-dependent 7-cyano-7-deazaguanine reductase QueF [Bermanella sp. R86510]|uniref:NADPH-dependent 7-cyano-7-deazaguanine reductase QueF n=1 Tax=unclassified Bermanella TaxID=2627862 RepID=UPI0037C8BD26
MKDDILLGKETEYKSQYDASLIYPIERAANREKLTMPTELKDTSLPFYGIDVWTGYEISWLNPQGKPQVAIAEFVIPCESSHIVESKSFKLYLNSFNNTRFEQAEMVRVRMQHDLSAGFGADIDIRFFNVGSYDLSHPDLGDCIDDEDVNIEHYTPAPELLKHASGEEVTQRLHSHLLKSNCPVTNQPDWATVIIDYRGTPLDRQALLKYIISYREHDDFHEHCVEQIFCDLLNLGGFEYLTVTARYTRRGGLDINPSRSTHPLNTMPVGRMPRQ